MWHTFLSDQMPAMSDEYFLCLEEELYEDVCHELKQNGGYPRINVWGLGNEHVKCPCRGEPSFFLTCHLGKSGHDGRKVGIDLCCHGC